LLCAIATISIATNITTWSRLKQHFVQSFTNELVSPSDEHDQVHADRWRGRRRRNAYRYVLLLVTAVVFPFVLRAMYLEAMFPSLFGVFLLVALLVNIYLLGVDREALLPPYVVLFFTLSMVSVSVYSGEMFSLLFLFPLWVVLPIMLNFRWAAALAAMSALSVLPIVVSEYDVLAAVVMLLSLVLTWIASAWLTFSVTEQAKLLRTLAIKDPLTGAFNRRYLEHRAAGSLIHWTRYERHSVLLIIDIDYFKRINDKFGHAAGDKALKDLVDLVQQRIRKEDVLCRFGGEEFVLLLHEASSEQGEKLAEELRQIIAQAPILEQGSVTVSIGICGVSQAENVEHWFKLADAALYLAKRLGRNRVERATEKPPTRRRHDPGMSQWR